MHIIKSQRRETKGTALRAAVALPLLSLSVQDRAARGNWEDFDRIMARVPDASPVPGDER